MHIDLDCIYLHLPIEFADMGWEKQRRCNLPQAAHIPVPSESDVREQAAGHLERLMRYQEAIMRMDADRFEQTIRFAAKGPLKGEAFFLELVSQAKRSKNINSRSRRKGHAPPRSRKSLIS